MAMYHKSSILNAHRLWINTDHILHMHETVATFITKWIILQVFSWFVVIKYVWTKRLFCEIYLSIRQCSFECRIDVASQSASDEIIYIPYVAIYHIVWILWYVVTSRWLLKARIMVIYDKLVNWIPDRNIPCHKQIKPDQTLLFVYIA